jgi:LysM repeat protein
VDEVLVPPLRQLAEQASRLATFADRLATSVLRPPLPAGFGPRYQAFVAARALRDVGDAAGRLAGRAAVAARLEGPGGPGPDLASAAGDLAAVQAPAARAVLALEKAGVAGSGAEAARRELAGFEGALESASAALSVASGRALLLAAAPPPHPGASAPPAAHLAAALAPEDLARVGTAMGTPAALPPIAWTPEVVAAVVEAGRRLGLVRPGGIDSRPLAAWALGAQTAAGLPPRALDDRALLALLRHAGIALERLDPGQVRLATGQVAQARTLPEQGDALARVLDAFQVLARAGLPALPRELLLRAAGAPAASRPGIDVEGLSRRMGATATAAAAIAAGEAAAAAPLTRTEAPATSRPVAPAADTSGFSIGKVLGGVFKAIGGFLKAVGGGLKSFFNAFLQILPFILTVLSFIPVTAPFAMVANAALSVYTAIKTKNPLAIVGAAASFVGAGALVAAGRAMGAAAASFQQVADVAHSVARVAKGIAAAREGDLLGGLAAAAGGLSNGLGAVAGGAAGGLQRLADGLGELSGRVGTAHQVYQAARRGDLLGAVGLGAGLAADLGTGTPGTSAALAGVADGAARLRAAQAAIREGDYAGAAAVAAGLAAGVTHGATARFLARAGETLSRVAVAHDLVRGRNYLGAAAELAEAAAAHATSPATGQSLVDAAALLRRIGGSFVAAQRGDYVAAAGGLAGVVGSGLLPPAALDDRTAAQLQTAAAVFQRAAGIWPALAGGDFRAAEALARELAALHSDDPGNQVRFGHVVGFLHHSAAIQDLLRRGDYPGAAARLAGLAPGFLPTGGAREVLDRTAASLADLAALRRALQSGDYRQAAEIAGRMFQRIQDETARQTLQLGSGALDQLGAIAEALGRNEAPVAGRLGEDLARWLERHHPAARATFPSARELARPEPEALRAATASVAGEVGRASGEAVRHEAAEAAAGWVSDTLRRWTYVTQAGEGLGELARRFGVAPAALSAANPQAADPVPAGVTLVVPEAAPAARAATDPPTYTVVRGDTLSGIARRHQTTVEEILRLNPAVTHPDRISVGQVLRMPDAARPAPLPPAPKGADASPEGWWTRLARGIGEWLGGMFSRAGRGEATGPAAATAPAAPASYPGAVGGDTLALGANETYRDAVLLASERTGIDAAALAALVSAEAGRLRGARLTQATDDAFYERHPELERRALQKSDTELVKEWQAIHEEMKDAWDPEAVNSKSSATGLTQFLKGTWLDQARTTGTYLNEVAKEKGYVDENNRVVKGMTQDLLDLRTDPTLSIVAAAEYGKANLAHLDAKELVPADATDDEKARLMYLAHHEGAGGAVAFLEETLTDERAKVLLDQNVGATERETLVEEHGSEAKAYIAWLNGYMDRQIQPQRFRRTEE